MAHALMSKQDRRVAEIAAEHWLVEEAGCVVTRRAVRTKFQKVDFFTADVCGKRRDGAHIYVQVTAGGHSAVTSRRRKMEEIAWHESDRVLLLQLRKFKVGLVFQYVFRVWEFRAQSASTTREWHQALTLIGVPRRWFKRLRHWRVNEGSELPKKANP